MNINLIENLIKELQSKGKIETKEELETLITDLHRVKNDMKDLQDKNEELNNRFGLFWKEIPEKMIKNISDNEIVYGKSLYTFITKIKNGEGKTIKADINGEETKLSRQADSYLFKDSENNEYLVFSDSLYKFSKETQEEYIPILKEKRHDFFVGNNENNILIEGDNYYALQMLQYTHKGKIDAICIDPPYNTGKGDFKYNDKFIKPEDGDKHSRWLSFMSKRLELSLNLLSEKGVVFINIDENEAANLELLGKSIFPQYVGQIIWDKRSQKGGNNPMSTSHETILIFANKKFKTFNLIEKPNSNRMLKKVKSLVKKLNKIDLTEREIESYKIIHPELKLNDIRKLYKDKQKKLTEKLLQMDFDYWISKTDIPPAERAYSKIDFKKGDLFRGTSLAKPDNKGYRYDVIHPETKHKVVMPNNGWVMPEKTFFKWLEDGKILFGKNHLRQPEKKVYLSDNNLEKIKSVLLMSKGGVSDLKSLNLKVNFDYPKPIDLIKHLLSSMDNNIVTLDFFAGTGTTGHAVWDLNKEDGGNRKFILCTNNENNICEDVTFERLKRANEKYEYNESLKYLTINHVSEKVIRKEDNRGQFETLKEIVNLKYNSFKVIEENDEWYVNENIAILKDFDYIEEFKERFKKQEYLGFVTNEETEWNIFKEKLTPIKKEDNLTQFSSSYMNEIIKSIKGAK